MLKKVITSFVGFALAASALAGCSTNAASSASPSSAKVAELSAPTIAHNGELAICTALSTGNPPTYFTDASNKPTGAEIDMANWVAANLGLTPKYVDVAFASIIPALQAGKCDVIMSSLYIKPDRAQIVDFTPYLMSGSAVAVQNGNPKGITGMDDSLCGLKVSAAVGKTATLLAQQQAEKCQQDGKPELQVVQTDQTTAAVQQLINKQVDAYAGETPVVLYYQKKQPGTFEMTGKSFGEIEVGAAVKKGNTALSQKLQSSFTAMNQSGEYQKILQQWGMSDLAYKF
ncbi:polar amino acid transport system substrate-binding protein [Propionibacterium cyclohexanicum]|uniref:Polar amino acid transport system substrate-binding protein n=1 Tax=Propionibacterium cyclohexanicum TaxID=64702 RepID=A0A1H9SK11_9ACTN|nr:ABC transporter substrate-binding protein [Propionibacterium cyclohexanicum]SER84703.1 polar amino acid transport system substrate-binding protein [Propionibacterium cyclohexanicum]